MNKISMFFKRHPLLALFLTSVITISLINMAITLQSKRFSSSEAKTGSDSWAFRESVATVPEPIPSPASAESDAPGVQTADLEIPSRDDVFALTDDEISPADGFFFEAAESQPADAVSGLNEPAAETVSVEKPAGEQTEFEFAAIETDSDSAVDAGLAGGISVGTETAGVTAESGEITAAASAEEPGSELLSGFQVGSEPAEPEHADFFADLPADETADPVREGADRIAETVSETVETIETAETAEESAAGIAETAPSVPEGEKVDFFDNIVVSDPEDEAAEENTTSDLNWIATDLTGKAVKADIPAAESDDLGWELIDSTETASSESGIYEPHEPSRMVAENFDAQAEEAVPAETAQTASAEAAAQPAAESAAADVASAETSAGETAAAEPAGTVSTETASAGPAEPAVSAENGADAAAENSTVAENTAGADAAAPAETAAEPEVVRTDPVPAASQRCACNPRPVCTGNTRAAFVGAEPVPAAETAENFTTETAAAAPAPAAKAPAARGTQVWAVSTESLSGYTVQPSQLLCWRAEAGQFIASSVDEYKQTLSADIPTIILIHGNMTDWNGALRHAQSLKSRIDQMRARQQIETPYRLVIWKWASERQDQRIRSDSQVKAYMADLNGFYLASFLSAVNGTGCDVTMLGFSFGARTIGCALELMAGGTLYGHALPEEQRYVAGDRYHAILLAGACNYGDFSTKGLYAHGSNLISSMVNVFNPADSALNFYPLLYGPAGPQAIGVAPIDPGTAAPSYKNRLWSINSSGYGAQHSFDNLLYSICDPLLGNMIYAGKIWSAADAIPSVSDAVVDPAVKEKSDAEAARAEEEKIVAGNQ